MARTVVVAQGHPAAADTNPATEDRPLKTIQAGADLAQPGDVVLVHAGTYRERVTPPRGGDSEQRRIVYRAASGEQVFIKGSERLTNWRRVDGGLWMVQLEPGYFGDYNPYELTIRGDWLDYGEGLHRGDVYLDGVAYSERRALYETQNTPNSWYTVVENGRTTIWANFGDADPTQRLAEINVRRTVFFPEVRGLKYITVDGFTIMHSAENWGPPGTRNGEGQWGAIGTRWGYGWIIENCTVINAKCIGICLGVNPDPRPRPSTRPIAPGNGPTTRRGPDPEPRGHHIVRNNHLLRCGQAGIAGDSGAVFSLIDRNLVEFTNDRGLFGGDETAGIKFHFTIDTIISNNCIRGVGSGAGYGGFGIWLDFGNQNTRVTGNVIYDTETACLFIEASHGPILVDNNVFIGNDINAVSEAQVFVHNLFYRANVRWSDDTRRPPVWEPHAARRVRSQEISSRDDKWYNNIFIGGGLAAAPDRPGFAIDYNVYLDGAARSRYDEHSLVDSTPSDFVFYTDPALVAVDLRISPAAAALRGPKITSAMLGTFPVSGMMMENPDGSPIEVAADFFGRRRDTSGPGPFAALAAGTNSFTVWSTVKGDPRPYRITVSPPDVALKPGTTQQFSARAWDQYGQAITPTDGFVWSVTGGGTIDGNGLFSAGGDEGGPWRVSAALGPDAARPVAQPTTQQGAELSAPRPPTGSARVWLSQETPGLAYSYYEYDGDWPAVGDLPSLKPLATGTVGGFDLGVAKRPDLFAIRFDGRIYVPVAGRYTFIVHADDGARLYIDGALIVDNDGGHAVREARGSVDLKAGMHPIALTYFEGRYQQYLRVEWQGPDLPRQDVPHSVLFAPR